MGRFEEALADYGRAIDLNPYNALAFNNRGLVYRKLQRYGEALDNMGRHEEAMADYGRAIELSNIA